jgi:hypothetical protein
LNRIPYSYAGMVPKRTTMRIPVGERLWAPLALGGLAAPVPVAAERALGHSFAGAGACALLRERLAAIG